MCHLRKGNDLRGTSSELLVLDKIEMLLHAGTHKRISFMGLNSDCCGAREHNTSLQNASL